MGYMNAKGYITTGILLCGFIGFIVGVPSYEMIYQNPALVVGTPSTTTAQPSYSYTGACDDSTQYNAHCASLTSDFWHCMNGDKIGLTYTYSSLFWAYDPSKSQDASSNFLDETTCSRMMTCQAFGLMAIILSGLAVIGAVFHKSGRIAAGICGIIGSFFGAIALAIFFSSKPEFFNNLGGIQGAHNSDLSDFLTNGFFKLGYSTGLQIAGMAGAFIGGITAVSVGEFAEQQALAGATHKTTGSVGGNGGVEMH